MVRIDVSKLYEGTAKLENLPTYEEKVVAEGCGADVTLTGAGPVWLYLRLAHRLHGVARRLWYDSPVSGPVLIFDHSPN